MRTTLDLDEDILQIAKELARQQRKTAGQVVSELVRKSLAPHTAPARRNGVPLLPANRGGTRPTMELVNQLRDEE